MTKGLRMIGIVCLFTPTAEAFTACNCNNLNNMVESYWLLDLSAYPGSDGNREMETKVFGEIVQIKLDRIISVFRYQVIKPIMSLYCGQWNRFREPKAKEVWEGRWRKQNGKCR
jgi:hypothetical protein